MTTEPVAADASTETPPDTPELAVRTFKAMLVFFERSYGRAKLEEAWAAAGLGLPLAYVEDVNNFVSLHFVNQLFDALVKASGDPDFAFTAGMQMARPEALGALYYMLKALGTPMLCYQKTIELGPTYNRVGGFKIEALQGTRMSLRYTSKVRERHKHLCRARQANFACFTTIWGLPPATIKETQCNVDGADSCLYELEWQNPPPKAWRRYAGFLLGAVAGFAVGRFGLWPLLPAMIGATSLGTALGLWLDYRTTMLETNARLREQTEAMMTSMRDLQKRTDEVFKANVELERRVAERTQELTHSKEKLEEALEQQREMDRLKTRFFDNVSHELRTPLTLILLTLESLQQVDEPRNASFKQHLDRMERSASRLMRLINELLDLAKIGAGKMRLRYQQVDLRELLNAVIIPFRVLADEKKVELKLEVPDDLDVLQADFEKLDIVFQNLISNALKFTQQGHVRVRVSQDAFYVYASVEDTGAGIGPEDLGIIFDRFAQADSAGTRRIGGTGIGLALVKETVELHGGNISVTSRLGEGSSFTVAIPRGTAHIREDIRERRNNDLPVRNERRIEDGMLRQRRQLAAKSVSTGPEDDAPAPVSAEQDTRPTILVVEDERELRGLITSLLRPTFKVVEASDGAAGLERARELVPALIVSDVMMPKMSGLQLLSALRSDPKTLDIPVILLTARHDVDARVHGLAEGANDYVGKPFSPRELLARIEAQLRLRDATARIAQTERLAATSLITSGFAHEVRNPLNGLMNALVPLKESLSGATDRATADSMLQVVEESGQRIRQLAESLLSMVRESSGRQPTSVSETFDAAERALKWKLDGELRIEKDWGPHAVVNAEAPALTQLWINLLDNALRAIEGRKDGRIWVKASEADGKTVIELGDNGTGIAPEHLPRIFEPFFSTRSAGEGTGLGLALCRRIVVAHQGQIDLRSVLGEGTTIVVTLPSANGALGALAVPDGRGAPATIRA